MLWVERCIHAHMSTCARACARRLPICMSGLLHAWRFGCVRVRLCAGVDAHVGVYVCGCVCVCVLMYVCVHVCGMCACLRVSADMRV